MKKRIGFLLTGMLLLLASCPVSAAQGALLFSDTFQDVSKVDLNRTTAWVDTTNHDVELWHPSQTNVIATHSTVNGLLKDIVVATSTGIQWYTINDQTGKVELDPVNSSTVPDALGVALAPESQDYWVFTDQGSTQTVQLIQFDGSGMAANPTMAVSGLSNVVAISAVNPQTVAVADRTGEVSVYTYNSATGQLAKNPTKSFATGLTNIRAVNVIPGTFNVVVTTANGSYEYVLNETTGVYQQNAVKTVTTSSQTIVSGAVVDGGNFVSLLDPSKASAYQYNMATGTMSSSSLYTVGPLTNAIAVSLPSDTSTVLASKNGTVTTYQFNQATGTMTLNPNLTITGLAFTQDYKSPSIYQSIPITPTTPNNMFEIVPTEQNDPGTSITYALSVDGGNTFTAVQPNTWIHLPAGTTNPPSGGNVPTGPYLVQATLISSSNQNTARLIDIALEGYLDVTSPTAPGQPTGNPSPSYSTTTMISWAPASDPIQAPSTGASGIQTYLFRYSTDGGVNWTGWIDTNSSTPGYVLTVPMGMAANYTMQVKAIDNAGNIGPESPVGTVFIDTNPLGIVPTPNGSDLTVTQIQAASDGQTYPTDQLPVYVKAGGEVIYEITTTGNAQSVEVVYSDGSTQTLYPKFPVSSPSDTNVWQGYYYPSSIETIPLSTPQGTVVSIQNIKVMRSGSSIQASSPLLIVSGSLSPNKGKFIPPHLSN